MAYKFEHALIDSWKPVNKEDMIAGEIFIMQEVEINGELIPAIELVDADGIPWQVLMSQYALQKVFLNPLVEEEGYLVIKYDGESESIQKAGNFAKKFSIAYYAPGDWSIDEKGNFNGNPTRLRQSTKALRPAKAEKPKPQDWKDAERENDGKPFNPEEREEPKTAAKASKASKAKK